METGISWKIGRTCLSLLAAFVFAGCVNVASVRNPFSSAKVRRTYQSTLVAANAAEVVAFPQVMSDDPKDWRLDPVNVLTVPLGLVVLCDAAAEAAVDTVCWPADHYIAKARSGKD